MKKVLVTGADGFIGSHLTESLLEKGYDVKAFTYYNSFNTWGWLDTLPKEKLDQIEVFSGDVRDPNGVREAMKGVDQVFHLAALIAIPFSYHSPDSYVDTNIKGTLNVLQAARDLGTEKIMVTSTSEVYGTAQYVPIDEKDLPLRLPMVESYEPTDNGESPLAKMTDWINTTCPCCGGKAKRETDTMPQWAGSSWYYLRYMDPHNKNAIASKEALNYWSPVDWYNGGMEHTTLHLLYSRFWHKFLYDIGVVPTPEPYAKRTSHGMILGENGEKMSKSRGNVVNPDEIVDEYGADTMRLYEMFIGDFEKAAPWSKASIRGCRRFVERYWNLQSVLIDGDKIRPELEGAFNKAIKKVGEDIENIKFNTAIATLMALINDISNVKSINKEELRIFSILLNPFAPHVTEEVYEACKLGNGILAEAEWPEYDESKCVDESVEIVVQVNGKIKAKLNIPVDADKDAVLDLAKNDENVKKAIDGMKIIKEIVVPKKLVNLVVKP